MNTPTDQQADGMDFATVMASTVHDMKNTMALMLQTYDTWLERLPPELSEAPERGIIQYESMRLHGMLVQLLGLYKMETNRLPLNPGYFDVEDFLQDQLARHDDILRSRHIQGDYQIDEDGLMGFFDNDLISSVVANVINNSIRYARNAISLRAWMDQGKLIISICDDGDGYPEVMIEQQANYAAGIRMSTGSTGLGLYFGQQIAQMHKRNDEHGFIELRNDSPLGGGEFRLVLP